MWNLKWYLLRKTCCEDSISGSRLCAHRIATCAVTHAVSHQNLAQSECRQNADPKQPFEFPVGNIPSICGPSGGPNDCRRSVMSTGNGTRRPRPFNHFRFVHLLWDKDWQITSHTHILLSWRNDWITCLFPFVIQDGNFHSLSNGSTYYQQKQQSVAVLRWFLENFGED